MKGNPLLIVYRVLGLAFLVVFIGVLGYRALVGLGWIDALYMTIITLSTVGFREVGPGLTDSGKIFTIALILGGAGVLAFALKMLVEVVLDDSIRIYLRHRSAQRRLAKMKEHYIVCGLGRVGRAVCQELHAEKIDFVLIDTDTNLVQETAEKGWTGLLGDATEDATLKAAGVERARGLMSCVTTDSDNLMIIVTARGLAPHLKISARVSDERNTEKLRRAGADFIYSPFALVGRRIARALTQPRVTELLDLALEQTHYDLTISEFSLTASSYLVGKTLMESNFRNQFGGVILAIIRADRSIVHSPAADVQFQANDILVVLGTPAELAALRDEKRHSPLTNP
jgi:voltage-gated potassium channel